MRISRYLFAAVAAVFLLGIMVQVFFAGSAAFGSGSWQTHVDFGYGVAMVPVLLIILVFPARGGRRLAWLSVATLIVAQVQTALPLARESLPWLAALHPVNAMLVFGLGVMITRRGIGLARSDAPAPGRRPEPAAPRA